jgi:hypothetical protein
MSTNSIGFALGDQIHTTQIEWLRTEIIQQHNPTGHAKRYHHHIHPRIWADEPHWTSYHAASWHALRNDNWTGMPFSPKRIGNREYFRGTTSRSQSTFHSMLGGYSALADLLALGGIWRNPVHSFEEWQSGYIYRPDNFTLNFIKFWLPMINTYAEWFSHEGWIQSRLPYRTLLTKRRYGIQLDRPAEWSFELTSEIQGSTDSLHLTSHTCHPFHSDFPARISVQGDSAYRIMTSESYEHWALELLNTEVREETLVRVDIRVHESMTALTTLGHFLLTPGQTDGRDDSGFPVAIRYVNDHNAIEYAAWRGLL